LQPKKQPKKTFLGIAVLEKSVKRSVKLLSILKPKSKNSYYAEFELNGKIQRKSLKTKNKIDAVKKWDILASEIEKNLNKEINNTPSIQEAFENYLNYRSNNVQSSTFRSDKWSLLKLLKYLESINIFFCENLTPSIIYQFLENLSNEGKTGKTINNYISLLSRLFNYFKEKHYISENFIDTKKLWKKRKKKNQSIFSKKEARIIIERIRLIEDIEYRTILLSPFFTGLRFSELRALNRKNIDLEKRFIYVMEKQTPDDKTPIRILKSKSAQRKIPILKEYQSILTPYLEIIKSEYIFANINYKRLSELRRSLEKELNIPFRFHDGRHFFASLLINNGFDIKKIQYILGHESINQTIDIYGHLIEKINPDDFDRINF